MPRTNRILKSVLRFVDWLNRYGETSYDFQTFYASEVGRQAKALYYKKPPLGNCGCGSHYILGGFVPSLGEFSGSGSDFRSQTPTTQWDLPFWRRFWTKTQYYEKAVHFLEVLKGPGARVIRIIAGVTLSTGRPYAAPFAEGTPLITTVPYVYEAFREVWETRPKRRMAAIMQSIAQHALEDYKDFATSSNASTCSYTPDPEQSVGVVNANAYRAFLLTSAAKGSITRIDSGRPVKGI